MATTGQTGTDGTTRTRSALRAVVEAVRTRAADAVRAYRDAPTVATARYQDGWADALLTVELAAVRESAALADTAWTAERLIHLTDMELTAMDW